VLSEDGSPLVAVAVIDLEPPADVLYGWLVAVAVLAKIEILLGLSLVEVTGEAGRLKGIGVAVPQVVVDVLEPDEPYLAR
jgi:hypothetical protein